MVTVKTLCYFGCLTYRIRFYVCNYEFGIQTFSRHVPKNANFHMIVVMQFALIILNWLSPHILSDVIHVETGDELMWKNVKELLGMLNIGRVKVNNWENIDHSLCHMKIK